MSTLSEHKFAELQSKLRQLFELDKSDLDFGIYRIINARNKEITAFLDRQLKDEVRSTLIEHGAAATDQIQQELDATLAKVREVGAEPEKAEKVQELKAKLATAGPSSIAALEADIYNHLLVFFGRYYDEGDFIARRRYKGDTYAIPYNGEEVTMYWANKDQYYIKSGEWHKDYRFRVGERTVHFKVIAATQEAGNNKERDDAKRRFILDAANPIETPQQGANAAASPAIDRELVLRFQFRVPTAEETQAVEEGEATRIFGGDYDKGKGRKMGTEIERFCAHAEKLALAAAPAEWRQRLSAVAATDDKPQRTILGKHLAEFTARNTFDYFIHKDLGGFLRRELDFYIKNEVVRLDDLERLPPDHLARVQGRVKAIRRVAGRIIDLLAAIEDFQKKMWLKKKFVLNTSWLITMDRIPPHLRDVVAANKAQWDEWERLGLGPAGGEEGMLGSARWGSREYLDRHTGLVVDSRLLPPCAAYALCASAHVLGAASCIDDGTTGIMINAENSAALRLLKATFRDRITCVYLDPPYNTGTDGFAYRDAFQHSSWAAMMTERIECATRLMPNDSAMFVSIDDREHVALRGIMASVFGPENMVANVVWQKKYSPQNDAQWFSDDHDFIVVFARSRLHWFPAKLPRTAAQDQAYTNPDGDPRGPWKSGDYTCAKSAAERPNLYYGIRHPHTQDEVWPSKTRVWAYGRAEHEEHVRSNQLWWGHEGKARVPALKRFLADMDGRVPQTIWTYLEVGHNQDAVRELAELVPSSGFASPKPSSLIRRVVGLCRGSWVLDFFAGSGTTGHAVLQGLRANSSKRQFVLVDNGVHFNHVLAPRIIKCVYSDDWKDGAARLHHASVSAMIKVMVLESYEDALYNLGSRDAAASLIAGLRDDPSLRYSLDLELGPHLLDLDAFKDPWGYTINAQLPGDPEIRQHSVDLVETFNYLIGLRVSAYGPLEHYAPEFERADHPDGLGRLRVKGRLRPDADGPFAFHRVEGELNDGRDTRVLVIWRKLTGDPEQDAAVLDAWMARHHEDTTERSEHRDFHLIYVNGPVTLPQPTESLRTVLSLEETFKARMFEDTEDA